MIGDDIYVYYDVHAPNLKIDYSYSKFHGTQFLESWKTTRNNFACAAHNQFEIQFADNCQTETALESWYKSDFSLYPENYSSLLLLLKRFEVTRKIYDTYDGQFRPVLDADFTSYRLYALFGLVLIKAYDETGFLPFLNALLKTNDILVSRKDELDDITSNLACISINEEIIAVGKLIKSLDEK